MVNILILVGRGDLRNPETNQNETHSGLSPLLVMSEFMVNMSKNVNSCLKGYCQNLHNNVALSIKCLFNRNVNLIKWESE